MFADTRPAINVSTSGSSIAIASVSTRFRRIAPDLATLAGGMAVLLVVAGIVESFFSQYHEPVLPYAVKIAFGAAQLIGLFWFLNFCGREETEDAS